MPECQTPTSATPVLQALMTEALHRRLDLAAALRAAPEPARPEPAEETRRAD